MGIDADFNFRTIKSVEEHIKESIVREIISPKSMLKGIKIALESMEIKRLLNAEILKSASFHRETVSLNKIN